LEKVVADSATMQGRHSKQEDRHVKIPDLTKAAKALKMPIDHLDQPCSLLAVYDGHRGINCVDFVAKGFHGKLLKKLSADTTANGNSEEHLKKVLTEVVEELDIEFMAKHRTSVDGATLAVALVSGSRLFTAWLGDCRCLLGLKPQGAGPLEVSTITEDHRPSFEAEAARIKAAGGVVLDYGMGCARVAHEGYEERIREIMRAQAQGLGNILKEPVALDVSRALGNRDFKGPNNKPLLIATPSVAMTKLGVDCKMLALITGGIPVVMYDADVIYELDLQREADLAADVRAGCGALVQEAYTKESAHNLTVILARFQWANTPGYARKSVTEDKAEKAAKALMGNQIPEDDKKAASAASKKRRMEAAAAVNAQKQAAYERSGAAASYAEEEAKREAELKRMRAEVEEQKAEAAKKLREERMAAIRKANEEARKAEEAEAEGEGLDAAEAFFAARKAQRKNEKDVAPRGQEEAEAFFLKRKAERDAEKAAAGGSSGGGEKGSGLDAAEAFFSKRNAEKAESSGGSAMDAAEAFFAKRNAEKAAAQEPAPSGGAMDAAEAFFAKRNAEKAVAAKEASSTPANPPPSNAMDAAEAFFAARKAAAASSSSSAPSSSNSPAATSSTAVSTPSTTTPASPKAATTTTAATTAAATTTAASAASAAAAAPAAEEPAEDDDLTFL